MADVRSKIGAPITSDFDSHTGTPIVCNQTTGGISVLKINNTIQEMALVGGSASQTFSVAPATTGTMAPQAAQLYATSILVNESFLVNNGNAGTAYVSAAVLASGAYGHEMWKAGASGGDYSFTQNAATTQITIASGKSLIQVVEDAKVCSTTYVLSWTGTAQARYAVNSATPSGSYASSPIYITDQTIGTTMSVEFNTGTLFEPALIEGTLPLKAVRKTNDFITRECLRYAPVFNTLSGYGALGVGQTVATTAAYASISFLVPSRIVPTGISVSNPIHFSGTVPTGSAVNYTTLSFNTATTTCGEVYGTGAVGLAPAGGATQFRSNSTGAFIMFTGCRL